MFDIDPTKPMSTSDLPALPTLSMTTYQGRPCLALTFREFKYLDPGATITVQSSNSMSLGSWTTPAQAVIIATGATTAGDSPATQSAGTDPIMQALVPITNPSGQFIRLNITP